MKKLFLLLAAIVTLALSASAQNRTINGTVLSSADSEPLAGATVKPVGIKANGVMTNINGEFTISVPANVKEVTVSYVGMKPVTVAATEDMKVFLESDAMVLDQVVVTGYGSGKKLGSVVGAVAVVGQDVIKATPASNFVDALQGQVSSLSINQGSGDPNSNPRVTLRGQSSLSGATDPLYICDGAPISSSFFNSMNPDDIESITVLKDGASISIYGSRGANGVIVITTKKGKFGAQARATVRANYGWSSMTKDNTEMMNSQQYMEFRDLIGQPLSADIKNLINNYGISTSWRDEMFNDNAPTYSLEGNVTGGSDNLSYYLSLGHYNQKGIIENSEMKRTTLAWSLDAKVNSWFRVGFIGNVGYRQSKTNLENDDREAGNGLYLNNPMLLSRMALPYDSPYNYKFNDNGDIVWGSRTEQIPYSGIKMPWYIYSYNHYGTNRLTGNVRLYEQITPIKGLTIKAQQAMEGYDYRSSQTIDPRRVFVTDMGVKVNGSNVGEIVSGANGESFTRYYQFTYTNTAEYIFNVAKKHNVSLLVGQEAIIARSNGFGVSTNGTTDIRTNLLDQGTTVTMGNVSYSKAETVNNSFFVNGSYDYDNKYFFDFSYRRDGSSKLAPENRWANFGAFGVMWNLKNEFLKDSKVVNDLRLHYSYGSAGNDGVSNFAWMGTLSPVTPGYENQNSTILNTGAIYNPNLKWEVIWTHDLGVNVRLFDRLNIAADYYKRTTNDMIYTVPFSLTTGVASGTFNICSMVNQGFEFEIDGDIFKNKDWQVNARFQVGYNKNEITELWDGNDEFVIANTGLIMEKGGVFGQYYLVRYVGIDPADGKQMWLDKNDNITKEFPEDAYVKTGKSQYAPWTGGFGATVRWKGLSATANFVFQSGKYGIYNDKYFICNPSGFGGTYNQSVDAMNFWREPGQVTDVPAYGEELFLGEDTSWLEDASFTRLKNLTVAYDFPKNVVKKLGLSALQLHFTGRNLWTITNFAGYDPEPQTNMFQFQYPNTRQYEFGIEVSF